MCSHFIDIHGNVVDERLDGRVVGASLEDIQKVENKLLLAVGEKKAKAVVGALRGGYADVLYIDEQTARRVLELSEK